MPVPCVPHRVARGARPRPHTAPRETLYVQTDRRLHSNVPGHIAASKPRSATRQAGCGEVLPVRWPEPQSGARRSGGLHPGNGSAPRFSDAVSRLPPAQAFSPPRARCPARGGREGAPSRCSRTRTPFQKPRQAWRRAPARASDRRTAPTGRNERPPPFPAGETGRGAYVACPRAHRPRATESGPRRTSVCHQSL